MRDVLVDGEGEFRCLDCRKDPGSKSFFKALLFIIIIIRRKFFLQMAYVHIMWFSIGHCINTKNYSTRNIKIGELKNVTLSELTKI